MYISYFFQFEEQLPNIKIESIVSFYNENKTKTTRLTKATDLELMIQKFKKHKTPTEILKSIDSNDSNTDDSSNSEAENNNSVTDDDSNEEDFKSQKRTLTKNSHGNDMKRRKRL